MKASIRRRYGPPASISIEQVDQPTPKDNEVLIKVHFTTVNRTDCANLTSHPFFMRFILGFPKPREVILGTDFAGEIVAKGSQISSFSIGDRVFGFKDMGAASQAEYLTVSEKQVFHIPGNIAYKVAAASLEGASYAHSFLHRVNLQPGQHILINGATGAIGSALLQFVRQYDVHITATCSTSNIERIRALGADKIYDYTKEDFTASQNKYDYVFDTVGKSTFGKCKPILKQKGIYISSELGPWAQNIFYALSTPYFNKKVIFPIPYGTDKTIPYISGLLEQSAFKPMIDREYDLDDIAAAYTYVLTGQKVGNVLVRIAH